MSIKTLRRILLRGHRVAWPCAHMLQTAQHFIWKRIRRAFTYFPCVVICTLWWIYSVSQAKKAKKKPTRCHSRQWGDTVCRLQQHSVGFQSICDKIQWKQLSVIIQSHFIRSPGNNETRCKWILAGSMFCMHSWCHWNSDNGTTVQCESPAAQPEMFLSFLLMILCFHPVLQIHLQTWCHRQLEVELLNPESVWIREDKFDLIDPARDQIHDISVWFTLLLLSRLLDPQTSHILKFVDVSATWNLWFCRSVL